MGISIHYKGHLRTKPSLPALVEEVEDIVKIYKWPYRVFETEFPVKPSAKSNYENELYGISFTPPESETISLLFLPNGRLISIFGWHLFMKSGGADKESLNDWVSVKTHYAGEFIHKLVIHLLDHISKKYFRNFKMMDEGQYWETRDENLLHQKFTFLNGMLNTFAGALESEPMKQGESFEEYFKRIMKGIRQH